MSILPSTDLLEFAEAAMAADYTKLRKAGQKLARALESSDMELARRLRLALNKKGVPLQASGFTELVPVDGKSRLPLVEEQPWPSTPILLNAQSNDQLGSFLKDVNNFELLAAKGISSKLSLMLSGPPGTGKTLLAGHIAAQLGRKLYIVRLDSVISSMLGDTSKNIRSVFDFVAGKDAVLFLDELDAVAKMRDDRNELGELKRVVNTVLQGLDSADDRAVIIAATNHGQMLDKAIWRRFPYKIEFAPPDVELRTALWQQFLDVDTEPTKAIGILADISQGMSGAEIEHIALAARRNAVLDAQDIDYVAMAIAVISQGLGIRDDRFQTGTESRKSLAVTLVRKHGIPQSEVARFLGVSRQAVSNYLKVIDHGKGI